MDALRDVFQIVFALVLEVQVEAGADVIAHGGRNRDATRIGHAFQASGDVHAIAKDVTVLDDDIAEVDADAHFDPALGRHLFVAGKHTALDFGRACDRVHDTLKFGQQPVAGVLDDPAAVRRYGGVDQFRAVKSNRGNCPGLVQAHEAAVAHDVGSKNCCQTAFQVPSKFLLRSRTVIYAVITQMSCISFHLRTTTPYFVSRG